jgi:hypothetical protein
MLCATLLVTGQCLFVCGGSLQEFYRAWNWPESVRWDNRTQRSSTIMGCYRTYTAKVTT